ncbi:MAG: hypothetical protein RRB13_06435 [bacterium]|nr:hypothetical protein [bacterium]
MNAEQISFESQPKAQVLRQQLLGQGLRLGPAGRPRRLLSGRPGLDQFLEGGLPLGGLTEWGLPLGSEGRALLMPYLAAATGTAQGGPHWCLWISCHDDWKPFPPAFLAAGVAAERLVFAESRDPLKDLQPALVHPLFRLLVLDSPPRLGRGALSFLEARARTQGQAVLVLRPFFLSNKLGNVWARFRVNGWRRPDGNWQLKALRGLRAQEMSLSAEDLTGPLAPTR